MHVFILAGSHRLTAESTKVAGYIEAQLALLFPDTTSFTYDLRWNPLPLRSEGMRDISSDFAKEVQPIWQPVAKELAKADAVVVISPEWSWMATPWVKNFFLYANPQLLGNKPWLLVAVSSGRGWQYPIAELRMSSTKNTQLCYIPQHVIINHVTDVLNKEEPTEKSDIYIRERLKYSLHILHQYALWLQWVRKSGVADFETYPHGM